MLQSTNVILQVPEVIVVVLVSLGMLSILGHDVFQKLLLDVVCRRLCQAKIDFFELLVQVFQIKPDVVRVIFVSQFLLDFVFVQSALELVDSQCILVVLNF